MASMSGQAPFYGVFLVPRAALCHASGAEPPSMACVRLELSTLLWRASGVDHRFMARVWGLVPFYGVRLAPSAVLRCAPGFDHPFMACIGGKHHSMACVWGQALLYGMHVGPSPLLWCVSGADTLFMVYVWG